MRILMLSQSYAPVIGGEERVVEDLSSQLVTRGHDVAVATLGRPAGDGVASPGGVRVHHLATALDRLPGSGEAERRFSPPVPDPVTVRDLRRVVREERPDVVHAHNWLVHSYLPLAGRGDRALVLSLHDYGLRCATKRLFRHGTECSGPALRKCVLHAQEVYGPVRGAPIALGTLATQPWLRHRVDMFLPISTAVKELCGLGPGDPYRIVPNFIGDLPARTEDSRLEDLPDGPFILFVGDVREDKGARHLVDAYSQLSAPPPLIMLGRPMLDEPWDHPGIRNFGPWPHEVAVEAMRRSMFTVAPSLWQEPFGLVALEAAAVGKAIVASATGGLLDIVVDEETGLLVPPGDLAALRVALERLIEDSSLRSRLETGAAARARRFSPGAIVPQVEEAYAVALRGRRAALAV